MVIPVVRSRWRGVFAVVALLPWGLGLPLTAVTFGLEAVAGEGGLLELIVAAASGAASVATAPAQVQTVRALLSRPRITLETDGLIIHDPVCLPEAVRIPRELVAGAERLSRKVPAVQHVVEYDTTELSPYREPLNLELVLFQDHIVTSAGRRRRGTWIWLVARRHDRSPRFPAPGDRYRRIRVRVADPAAAVSAITEWVTTTVSS